ncbi:hypothetical protein GCM10010530_44650 [Kribbella aluminosa]
MTNDEKVAAVNRLLGDPTLSDEQKLDAIREVLDPQPHPEPAPRRHGNRGPGPTGTP